MEEIMWICQFDEQIINFVFVHYLNGGVKEVDTAIRDMGSEFNDIVTVVEMTN